VVCSIAHGARKGKGLLALARDERIEMQLAGRTEGHTANDDEGEETNKKEKEKEKSENVHIGNPIKNLFAVLHAI
jgi:hypothetical protein